MAALGGVRAAWVEKLEADGFSPTSLLTGTYDSRWDLTLGQWQVQRHYLRLVDRLNRVAFGPRVKRYKRACKHSYFGYFVAFEEQRRGQWHFHALIDNWVDFAEAIKFWHDGYGYLKCELVRNQAAALRYLVKYLTKGGGEPVYWKPQRAWKVERYLLNGDASGLPVDLHRSAEPVKRDLALSA